MSQNLWECIAPTLHIAINSDVNGLVLSIMDGIDTEWQAKSRTLGFSGNITGGSQGKVGSASKKEYGPLADGAALKNSSGAAMTC